MACLLLPAGLSPAALAPVSLALSISTLPRSAEAAQKLFSEALLHTVIVCDRYSAYKRLARLREGLVTLAFCWSHQRRDFIECAAGQVSLTQWLPGMDRADRGALPLNAEAEQELGRPARPSARGARRCARW